MSFHEVRQWTTLVTYIAVACYITCVAIFLGVTVSNANNVECLFDAPSETQICCATYWSAFAIGVPSCFLCVLLLCCSNVFTKHYVQTPVLCWLILTAFFGDFFVFYGDIWCTDKFMCLFAFGLLFQNNMIILLATCVFVVIECALWRQTRNALANHEPPV
jgi:hypothetical protein